MVAFEFVKHHTFLEAHWTRFFKHWAYNSVQGSEIALGKITQTPPNLPPSSSQLKMRIGENSLWRYISLLGPCLFKWGGKPPDHDRERGFHATSLRAFIGVNKI
ncbi:hypothetical protein H671_2g7646 [Cricetulus griseus]|nr:hypothetical protein H671_2g7646 [Cricetulus griseus]